MTTLGIFMKHPVPGQVKTRLGMEIGHELAAELARAFQLDLLDSTAGVAARRVIAYAPDETEAREHFRPLLHAGDELWPQQGSSLGERLSRFVARCRTETPNEPMNRSSGSEVEPSQPAVSRVVVIGSDSPTIPAGYIKTAFDELSRHDCVLGPAVDGGYYLVGLSRLIPEMFVGIDWSSPRVLAQTVTALDKGRYSMSLLPPWYDVDTRSDLEFLRGHLQAQERAGNTPIPRETRKTLTQVP